MLKSLVNKGFPLHSTPNPGDSFLCYLLLESTVSVNQEITPRCEYLSRQPLLLFSYAYLQYNTIVPCRSMCMIIHDCLSESLIQNDFIVICLSFTNASIDSSIVFSSGSTHSSFKYYKYMVEVSEHIQVKLSLSFSLKNQFYSSFKSHFSHFKFYSCYCS